MKVLLFVNGWVGWQVARWLARQDAEVVGLVLHPAGRRRYGREIEAAFPDVPRLDGAALRTPEARAAVEALQPVMGLSIYFGYLFEPALISCFPRGLVNLHPGLLPYNRGAYPNVWSLVDQTPAGVTLHQIDAGIDTGPVLAQHPGPHPTQKRRGDHIAPRGGGPARPFQAGIGEGGGG
ncbi:MAG: formyltransferase family protein, partial [Bacteroidota bacterium]